MIAAQSNALSLASLFYIPQSQGCTGGSFSAKFLAQCLVKLSAHQPNIRPMIESYMRLNPVCKQRHGERFSVAGGYQGEGFPVITTRGKYFAESKKKGSTANATLSTTASEYQPFGSMPRDCNSFRIIRLIQAEVLLSPSVIIACLIASSKDGSTRKAICLLPLGISLFDMCQTPVINCSLSFNVSHVSDTCKITMPRSAPTLTGHLTTTDSIIIEVAEMDHTTHPKGRHSVTQKSGTDPVSFVWIIAAVRRDCPTVKATIHHIAAATEREARSTLAKDHVCFFAGRIRQGVNHA